MTWGSIPIFFWRRFSSYPNRVSRFEDVDTDLMQDCDFFIFFVDDFDEFAFGLLTIEILASSGLTHDIQNCLFVTWDKTGKYFASNEVNIQIQWYNKQSLYCQRKAWKIILLNPEWQQKQACWWFFTKKESISFWLIFPLKINWVY